MVNEKDPPTAITARLEHASGQWTGVYHLAGTQDVIKALTQQTTEYLERVQDIKGGSLRVNQAQLDRIWEEWAQQDVNWKMHKISVTENKEAREEADFQILLTQLENLMMVQADATLGQITDAIVWFCSQPEDKFSDRYDALRDGLDYLMKLQEVLVQPLMDDYLQKARETYRKLSAGGNGAELKPQLCRYGLYLWVLRRRLGGI